MAQTGSSEENREMETKERILIVDDEPSIRKYLQTLLEVDGFEVSAVTNGKERRGNRHPRR
jgi:CheY-like chemotaxis protein